MSVRQRKFILPDLPPVGTILRARFDLDGGGHFRWPKGWTGEVVDVSQDCIYVRAFRYLGPGAHEWDNCRILVVDDGIWEFEEIFGQTPGEDVEPAGLTALALAREFEVA